MSVADEAGQYSFTVYKGQSRRVAMCRKVGGVATNWTGYSGLCQVRTKVGASTVITEIAVSFDVDRTTGNFYLDFTEDSLAQLSAGLSYVYDVRMTKTGADTLYPVKGTISVATRVSLPT